jgi:hypothetical protein
MSKSMYCLFLSRVVKRKDLPIKPHEKNRGFSRKGTMGCPISGAFFAPEVGIFQPCEHRRPLSTGKGTSFTRADK